MGGRRRRVAAPTASLRLLRIAVNDLAAGNAAVDAATSATVPTIVHPNRGVVVVVGRLSGRLSSPKGGPSRRMGHPTSVSGAGRLPIRVIRQKVDGGHPRRHLPCCHCHALNAPRGHLSDSPPPPRRRPVRHLRIPPPLSRQTPSHPPPPSPPNPCLTASPPSPCHDRGTVRRPCRLHRCDHLPHMADNATDDGCDGSSVSLPATPPHSSVFCCSRFGHTSR